MGLTSAMNTGATGLNSNQIMLETIGNNIANTNTTSFKTNRADFESLFSLTLREAAAPSDVLGGVNPSQVGLGSTLGSIQRSFAQGAIDPTGVPSDLAIEGRGFFIATDANGAEFFTRDGAFSIDVDTQLVTRDGLHVQGFAADEDGNVDSSGATSDLLIPVGALTIAGATSNASLDGNLNADSELASAAAVQTSAPLLTAAGPATVGTALTALVDASGALLFSTGDTVEVGNVAKGGFELPTESFVVGTGATTVGDLLSFIEDSLAVHTDAALGEGAGVTLDATGSIVVASNLGQANAIEIDSTDIRNITAGVAPFAFTTTSASAGDGESTNFTIYDSVGSEVDVRLRFALQSKGDLGTVWRFYAESPDDSDVAKALGTGTISFDQNGGFVGSTGDTLTVNRANDGGADVTFALDFSLMTGLAQGTERTEIGLKDQDGMPSGILNGFGIDQEGIITGSFSNGVQRTLGQVALATFINPNGLELMTDNNYVATVNSGVATITAANEGGAGRIESGALELSNVNLAREFIGLINASTGFSAASRVITTADELLQELLLIVR